MQGHDPFSPLLVKFNPRSHQFHCVIYIYQIVNLFQNLRLESDLDGCILFAVFGRGALTIRLSVFSERKLHEAAYGKAEHD